MAHPRKAWLIAPHAPEIGVDRDLADLERLFTHDLAPDCRAAVEIVRSDVGTLTTALLRKALDNIDAYDGDRFVWIAGHGVRRGLDTAFFATDDRDGGHITVEALWHHLAEIARRRRGMVFAVLDICHAAPPIASPLIKHLEASLIGFGATLDHQTARGTAAEGGWLTQRLIRALLNPTTRPADGQITVESLIEAITHDRITDNIGQTPFIVGKRLAAPVLNRLGGHHAASAPRSPIEAWRTYTRAEHERPGLLFEHDADRARVYVELCLTREQQRPATEGTHGTDGIHGIDGISGADALHGTHGTHATDTTRSPASLTLEALLRRPVAGGPGRWRVLGEPGAGKSTIARTLAARLAADPGQPIPVYLPLSQLAAHGGHPFDAAEAELARRDGKARAAGLAEALTAAADDGRVWLILDGLDEVDRGAAEDIRRRIEGWARALPRTPVVVLSRPFNEQPLAGFEVARVLPLDHVQQRALLTAWLGESRADLMSDTIDHRPRLRELAKSPLLLSLMALATDAGKPLAATRKALYSDAIEVLLDKPARYGRHAALGDNAEAARRLLGPVSVALHARGGEEWDEPVVRAEVETAVTTGEANPADLAVFGTAKAFLTELSRCGGVIGPYAGQDERWRYLHRSLREYLAAEHLAARPSRLQAVLGELEGATNPEPWEEQEQTRNPDHWGVVLGLCCALTPQPLDVLALVRAASRALALWALPEVELPPEVGLRFFDAVAGDADPAKHGEDLRRLVAGFPDREAARAAVMSRVGPTTPVERLAMLHYALSAAGLAVDDTVFFARAGRPMPARAKLVAIEGGAFMMGSPADEEGRLDDEVLHRVEVSGFELGAVPVTVGEYRRFDPGHLRDQGAALPVTQLSWYAARLYAAWVGCVLPREAEWEFACRAGTETRYWSGDDEADLARVGWYYGNAKNAVQPVGGKAANRWGLRDMHGNVWEWCADWYGPYEPAEARDPLGPPDGVYRVFRGGAAWYGAGDARSAFRSRRSPVGRGDYLGFRLARRPPST